MRNKEFYHTNVEIKEYPFELVTLEELNKDLIQTIKKFNSSKDIEYKKELAKQIPIKFPICRFCGEIIINSNFLIDIKLKYKTIQLTLPAVYCREIDGNKYYLSCCEKCLLDHFKDNPPKAPKYYFMKANIYGQYSFGYSNEEYKKICSMTVGVTYNSMVNKWGKELGEQKWKEYCDKHSKIASKQSFIDKYGLEEGLKIYHDSRAVTKQGMIKKYGKEIGLEKWNKYCERQRYTCSLEYFIKEYGNYIGKEKYNNFCEQRVCSGGWKTKSFSNISINLFNIIKEILNNHHIYNQILYGEHEKYINNYEKEFGYKLDFYDKTKNLIIEFQGDYWHCNPNQYNESYFHEVKNLYAKEIWEYDKNKKDLICKELNNPIYLQIWESDYRNDPQKIIKEILLYYNIKLKDDEYEI